MEKSHAYEIFEGLMRDLVTAQPSQPLDFLIQKLSEPQRKREEVIRVCSESIDEERRVFVVGPPGSKTTELALQLANEFRFTCVSVGDLLKK